MHKTTLRELSKFAAGLIAGDFLFGLWLYSSGMLPVSFLGMRVTSQTAVAGMVFDVIIFALLAHYGWRMQNRSRTKNERTFHMVVGTLLAIVALLHLARIIFGAPLAIGSWQVPYWLNGLGAVITAFLAYASFGLAS